MAAAIVTGASCRGQRVVKASARNQETLKTTPRHPLFSETLSHRDASVACPGQASGILAAVPPAADAGAMAKRLEARGIIVAPREGAVRFSPHFSNDTEEVARILQTVDGIG